MKVGLSVPWGILFTNHWYDGNVPPLVGVAVNVTEVPAHIVVAVAEIPTLTGSAGLTIIVPVALTVPQPPVKGME